MSTTDLVIRHNGEMENMIHAARVSFVERHNTIPSPSDAVRAALWHFMNFATPEQRNDAIDTVRLQYGGPVPAGVLEVTDC